MASVKEIIEIPLGKLEIGPAQARLRNVDKDVDELAESIRKMGLLEPIVVCETNGDQYEILTGQRRFLAHQKLQRPNMLCVVLDERVDETTAKAISLTENLVRKNLDRLDLIDACTALYKKYGSIKDVAKETGLPLSRVQEYVKYDQLDPNLKELVDKNEVRLKTALRAQKAATLPDGSVNADNAIVYAKEMSPMTGIQQKAVLKAVEEKSDASAAETLEKVKAVRPTQVVVTLDEELHKSLQTFASDEGTTQDDAAATLIEEGLSTKGYSAGPTS